MRTQLTQIVKTNQLGYKKKCAKLAGQATCGGEDEGCGSGGAEDVLDVVDDGFRELGEGGGTVILVVAVHRP